MARKKTPPEYGESPYGRMRVSFGALRCIKDFRNSTCFAVAGQLGGAG